MRLSEVPVGSCVVVRSVDGGPVTRRLHDVGFVRGTVVSVERQAPLGDPTLYELRGARIALRRSASVHIEVDPFEPKDTHPRG